MPDMCGSSFHYLEEGEQRDNAGVFIITIIFEGFTPTGAEEVMP